MTDFQIAKSIHVLAVVLWIGGVSFVTFILIPAIQNMSDVENQYTFFEKIEHKFAWQARVTTLLTGVSGFYMIHRYNLWNTFYSIENWWMHAMVFIWFLFTMMLFVLEPLFLHDYFRKKSLEPNNNLMKKVQRLHWVLSILSFITILGAMIGAH